MVSKQTGWWIQIFLALATVVSIVVMAWEYWQMRSMDKSSKKYDNMKKTMMWVWLPVLLVSVVASIYFDQAYKDTMPNVLRMFSN